MTLYDLGLIMLVCQVKDHQPSMAATQPMAPPRFPNNIQNVPHLILMIEKSCSISKPSEANHAIYIVLYQNIICYIYIICLESIETSWRRQIHHQRPWHVTGDFVPPSAGCLFGWTRSLSLCRACGSAPFDSWQLSHGAQNHCWLTIVRGIYIIIGIILL